ncbi:MAG: peptide deformylase [Epsilonproteobacteria bacterium]|nr:peptide deformylase [Campylobacterota bacterium]
MVRDIVIYPDKRINVISPDMRTFDADLLSVIQDLKDTMKKHKTEAMAAIQIAIPMSLIVIEKENGSYLEIINPRIIGKRGSINSTEETLYFPDTIQTVKRYEKIKLIYQDKEGNQQSLDAVGDFAILLQRKIDYVYGATLANRLPEKGRKNFEKNLSDNGIEGSFETCPTVFKRDYFISLIQKILFFIILANIGSFFISDETLNTFYTFSQYATLTIVILLIGYFFVAYYESKKYSACTSCQIGNIVGTTIKYAIFTLLLYLLSSFLMSSTPPT